MTSWKATGARAQIIATALLAFLAGSETAFAAPFMDYIKPRPVTCPLSSATWGEAGVRPRDLCNGIESALGADVPPEFYYWDGQIIRAQDGKYHMFMSTWSGANGFNPGWLNSDAYHAVSEEGVFGPYLRVDYIYNNNGSHKGHNVTALELPDGKYAVVVSETVPFTIYTSNSLDGPWTSCQPQIDIAASNVSLVARHDGRFQAVSRYGHIALSDTLCGHYVKQQPDCNYATDNGDTIYPTRNSIPNVPNPTFEWQEDPHIWYSHGTYHVIYSGSGDRVGWHVYSEDGLTNWQDNGYAWSPREYERLFCFEGTETCSRWYKMERPGVVLENGHPAYLTWAVADVDKDFAIPGNSNHGSKIIVIPFDGIAFDTDFGDGTPIDTGTGGTDGTGGMDGGVGGSDAGGAGSGGADTGGSVGSGGDDGLSTGGTNSGGSTGGAVATGGAASTTGGAAATGGTPGDGTTTDTTSEDAGCGCHVAGKRTNPTPLALMSLLALLGLRARRRWA